MNLGGWCVGFRNHVGQRLFEPKAFAICLRVEYNEFKSWRAQIKEIGEKFYGFNQMPRMWEGCQ